VLALIAAIDWHPRHLRISSRIDANRVLDKPRSARLPWWTVTRPRESTKKHEL
jgi:hypothetical protein